MRAVARLPALAPVGGPPLAATLKLAMQRLRTSGEHLALGALQFVSWPRCARRWLERFLDRSCQLCEAPVGSLWHRCYKCPPLRSSDVAAVRISTSKNSSKRCHCRCLRECFGQGSCWRTLACCLGLAPCKRRARHSGLWRWIPQVWAHEAVGTWWGMKVTAARPAPWRPPGHHSGGERRLLVVPALHKRPGVQHRMAVHPRVDLETDLGAHRRDRASPHSCEMGEGSRASWRTSWRRTSQLCTRVSNSSSGVTAQGPRSCADRQMSCVAVTLS